MDGAERIRERASIERYDPPVFGLDEPMWVAEDDQTDCSGVGSVEAEAIGNLVAVVNSHDHEPGSYAKLPGRVVERSWRDESGLL